MKPKWTMKSGQNGRLARYSKRYLRSAHISDHWGLVFESSEAPSV